MNEGSVQMTTQKLFKRRVRDRMAKTGESYAAARRHVSRTRERVESAKIDLAGALELASDEKVTEATGKGWREWLTTLDEWGARARNHRQTVDFLINQQAVPGWWAQCITNGYERTRGLRLKHQQADGFTIYASRTVGVPLDELFEAFVDESARSGWLTDGTLRLRTAQPGKAARFDWGDGPTRLLVTFEGKAPSRSTAHVAHERLPDADTAEIAKALWKKRLAALKTFLEADR
jgi:hypothetical protein